MKKILITGASGFVGPHMARELEKKRYEVFHACYHKNINKRNHFLLDITDRDSVLDIIKKIRPNYIIHLAGFSSIVESFKYPQECRRLNVEGTRNILDSLTKWAPNCRVLIVTSIHVYGSPKYSPVDEIHPLSADSPYAESRLEQENLARDYDLDVLIARSTNHTGPGQMGNFVVPEFCSQIVDIEKKLKNPVIYVGNLSVKKDFLDVRDVVRAYRIIIEKGEKKGIYNVCSETNITIKEMLDIIISKSHISNIQIVVEKDKYRKNYIHESLIDNKKIKSLGWKPTYPLTTTLEDTLKWIREYKSSKE